MTNTPDKKPFDKIREQLKKDFPSFYQFLIGRGKIKDTTLKTSKQEVPPIEEELGLF